MQFFEKEASAIQFELSESLLLINALELKAVLFRLKRFCSHLSQTHIKVLSDTTAVCAINNMGSWKSLLCDHEVRRIWSWTIERDIFITAAHILGILNVEADQESRKSELRTEWKFDYIQIFRFLHGS